MIYHRLNERSTFEFNLHFFKIYFSCPGFFLSSAAKEAQKEGNIDSTKSDWQINTQNDDDDDNSNIRNWINIIFKASHLSSACLGASSWECSCVLECLWTAMREGRNFSSGVHYFNMIYLLLNLSAALDFFGKSVLLGRT